jgi:hypothetical protein
MCGCCVCRATKAACTSTGAERHIPETQAKKDAELPGIGEDVEQQDHDLRQRRDGAAHSRSNESRGRAAQAGGADNAWYAGRGVWPAIDSDSIHFSSEVACARGGTALSGTVRRCGHVQLFKNTLSCLLHYKIICANMKSFR